MKMNKNMFYDTQANANEILKLVHTTWMLTFVNFFSISDIALLIFWYESVFSRDARTTPFISRSSNWKQNFRNAFSNPKREIKNKNYSSSGKNKLRSNKRFVWVRKNVCLLLHICLLVSNYINRCAVSFEFPCCFASLDFQRGVFFTCFWKFHWCITKIDLSNRENRIIRLDPGFMNTVRMSCKRSQAKCHQRLWSPKNFTSIFLNCIKLLNGRNLFFFFDELTLWTNFMGINWNFYTRETRFGKRKLNFTYILVFLVVREASVYSINYDDGDGGADSMCRVLNGSNYCFLMTLGQLLPTIH